MLLSGMMLTSTLVVGTSCSDDDEASSSTSALWNDVPGNEVINITPERNKMLRLYEYDDEGNPVYIKYNDESKGNVLDKDGNPIQKTKLLNPMQGWVVYGGLGDGLIDDFEEQYSNFETAEGQDNVFMYGGTMYVRGAWSDFEPAEEGRYIWEDEKWSDADLAKYKQVKRFRLMRVVEIARRLVQEQYVRLLRYRGGNHRALALASGER